MLFTIFQLMFGWKCWRTTGYKILKSDTHFIFTYIVYRMIIVFSKNHCHCLFAPNCKFSKQQSMSLRCLTISLCWGSKSSPGNAGHTETVSLSLDKDFLTLIIDWWCKFERWSIRLPSMINFYSSYAARQGPGLFITGQRRKHQSIVICHEISQVGEWMMSTISNSQWNLGQTMWWHVNAVDALPMDLCCVTQSMCSSNWGPLADLKKHLAFTGRHYKGSRLRLQEAKNFKFNIRIK